MQTVISSPYRPLSLRGCNSTLSNKNCKWLQPQPGPARISYNHDPTNCIQNRAYSCLGRFWSSRPTGPVTNLCHRRMHMQASAVQPIDDHVPTPLRQTTISTSCGSSGQTCVGQEGANHTRGTTKSLRLCDFDHIQLGFTPDAPANPGV